MKKRIKHIDDLRCNRLFQSSQLLAFIYFSVNAQINRALPIGISDHPQGNDNSCNEYAPYVVSNLAIGYLEDYKETKGIDVLLLLKQMFSWE